METVSAVVDRRREVASVALLLALTFVVVALVNYVPTDPVWPWEPSWSRANIANPCGPLGAVVAGAFFRALGYGAWVTFAAMVSIVLSLAGRLHMDRSKGVSAVGLLGAFLGMVGLAAAAPPPPEEGGAGFSAGGWLGDAVAAGALAIGGSTGAWILLGSVVVVCAGLLLRVRWGRVASRAVSAGESAIPSVGRGMGGILGRARGSVRDAVETPVKRMARALTREDEEDESERPSWDNTGTLEGVIGQPGARSPEPMLDLSSTLPVTSVRLGEVRYAKTEVTDGGDVLDKFPSMRPRPLASERPASPAWPQPLGATPESPRPRPDIRIPSPGSPPIAPPQMLTDLARGADPARAARLAPSTPAQAPASLLFDPDNGFGAPRQPAVGGSPSFRPQAGQFDRSTPMQATPRPSDRVDPRATTVGLESQAPDRDTPFAPERPAYGSTPAYGSAPGYGSETPFSARPAAAPPPLRPFTTDSSEDAPLRMRDSRDLPDLSLLDPVPEQRLGYRPPSDLDGMSHRVEETLESFKVFGKVTDVRIGPVVTTLEFLPEKGITVRRVASLQDDLAMALCATSVRIVAPIPGKGVVGIEIPSDERVTIYLRELLASAQFTQAKGFALPIVLGKDVEGSPLVYDLARMPHLLVGGTTGSGKSVGVNGMLMSLLFRKTPDELKLLLVDPKKLEFKLYEDIPHLLHPVVVEPKKAAAALAWACREMERRYELIARWGVRNIDGYNSRVDQEMLDWNPSKIQRYSPSEDYDPDWVPERLPYIVIVIDELADLMLVARKEVESSIARLTQMARACGIHLIVATQRPSVDVVTGLIKSNLPTRLSFKLRSGTDSRTILDQTGAESLLGRGDSLFLPPAGDLMRVHGPFVSDEEVQRVMDFLRSRGRPKYIDAITADSGEVASFDEQEVDPLYHDAVSAVRAAGKASTSLVQRHLKIGYNRAARIIDQMEMRGVVGPADGARPREVYPADLDEGFGPAALE